MFNNLIPALIITPALFAILGFLFSKRAAFFGIAFGLIFFSESLLLLYGVATKSPWAYHFGGWQAPLGIAFAPLRFGSSILGVSAFVMLLTFIYARFSLQESQRALFYPLSTFLALGLVVVYLSQDIFTIYVGLEIIGLCAVGLSALQKSPKALHASLVYLFSTLVASGFYLLGVAIIYAKYGLLNISALIPVIQEELPTLVAFGFMVVAFLLKTAVFPLSFWLANAHANAPTPVSALLSALVIKATFYLMYLFAATLFIFEYELSYFLAFLGVGAIFYGGIKAYLSSDLKLLIAYSTISQVGYLLLIFAFIDEHTDPSMAFNAMAFALFSHTLAKSGFFLAAGVVVHIAQTKEISALQGYASITPVSVFAIALSAVSLIGLPPSLGFVSKWYYLQSAYLSESWFFLFAIIGGGILSAAYLFKLLILFLEHPLEEGHLLRREKSHTTLEWTAFTLSFLSVFLAFFSNSIIAFMG
ncbi:MAG: proton-conducting transporter membrane subunit [Sulfuricurvum sp.]|nr:proton-conducting transporter membrane subunit [Sulfuricurvum sp.]MDP3023811.1 proton-conducting transporter membrane subunit [Sulfuricurvum sp.]